MNHHRFENHSNNNISIYINGFKSIFCLDSGDELNNLLINTRDNKQIFNLSKMKRSSDIIDLENERFKYGI